MTDTWGIGHLAAAEEKSPMSAPKQSVKSLSTLRTDDTRQTHRRASWWWT